MQVPNQRELQHPFKSHIGDLFQRSGVALYPSHYDYVKEPKHCCCVLVLKWREITSNYYKNNHARRHVVMHSHVLEVQGLRMKCNASFDLPEYEHYEDGETVYLTLKAIDHNESFVVEIQSLTSNRAKALPLLKISHSIEELFKPKSMVSTTYIPCCGIMVCKRGDLMFGKTTTVSCKDYYFQSHPLFDIPDEFDDWKSTDRVCIKLKMDLQQIQVMSAFLCPVGFCTRNERCHCEACKHIVSTYLFGRRILSNEEVIPKYNDLYFITAGLDLTCDSKNTILLITCRKCKNYQYVGQTLGVTVKERIKALCYEFRNDKKSRLCNHFRQKDHDGISDWEITLIDQTNKEGEGNLNDLEQLWIDRLDTLHKTMGGLNMNPAAGQKTYLFIADSKLINFSNALKGHDIVPKRFSGKSIEEIQKLAPTIIEREKPRRVILHIGSLDISSESKSYKSVAKEIIHLATTLSDENDGCEIWISGLLRRDGVRNHKFMATNKVLRQMCMDNHLRFVDHNKIDPSAHFKVDRHLNQTGMQIFTQNIDAVFQQKYLEDRAKRLVKLDYYEE